MVVDCVVNSRAALITSNVKDFSNASRQLGFRLFQPAEFMIYMRGVDDEIGRAHV